MSDEKKAPPRRPEEQGPLGKLVDTIVNGLGELFAPAPVPVPVRVRPKRR